MGGSTEEQVDNAGHFALADKSADFSPTVSRPTLRVVYIFAGHRRRADVHEHLQVLAGQHGFELQRHEVDLVRGADQDVLDPEYWKQLIKFIRSFRPFCIIATPPCSTYSRARHLYKQFPGPRPIRSREHPGGFPWLTNKRMRQAEQGTELANKTWELAALATEVDAFFLSEFPEDLGATDTGVPASLWQMQAFTDLLAQKGMRSFALYQCEFGGATPKPTRFLSDLEHFEGNIYFGIPAFDANWHYLGPLPRRCPHPGQHDSLIGMNQDGQWKTAPAAHYPGPLCAFLAKAIYKTWASSSSAAPRKHSPDEAARSDTAQSKSSVQQQPTQVEEKAFTPHPPHVQADAEVKVPICSGCRGPPIKAKYVDRCEEFCDGLGLCSPGRWHSRNRQHERTSQQTEFCEKLSKLVENFCRRKLGDLAQATMKLALGRFQASPFTAQDLEELRQEWFSLLPDPSSAKEVPPHQPFYLFALAQSLRLMGDPDADIIDVGDGQSSFVDGVHIGHVHPLGPVPQVYRPKVKEPSYDESEWSLSMDNYFRGSESEAQKILEEYFQEEELEGRMQPMSEKEAAKQYPGDALRIAAQGILDKPDGGHRIIHDGTHGVHLNNQIQSACRLENPGPRELATIMRLSEEAKEKVIFGLNGDIAKAHRRVRRQDWGVQACRAAPGTGILWLNRTGTFKLASAAFWWSRLMGLLGRHALNLLSDEWFFVLVFVDDLHLASGGRDRWASIWKFIAALEMIGTPFSY
eukprot:s1635_g2.t1